MELIAVALARAVGLLETQGADPKGRTSLHDALKRLAERYSFVQFPQVRAELDLQKGIDLADGKLRDINIDKLTLFTNGIVVDTRSSTLDSEAVIVDFLEFVEGAFGASVEPTRWMRLSNIVFRSNVDLSKIHSSLNYVASEISRSVSDDYGQDVVFAPSSVSIGADLEQIKLQPSPFTFERRSQTPFSAHTYFSAAPLNTEKHIELISYLEAAIG